MKIENLLFRAGKAKRAFLCQVKDGFRDRVMVIRGLFMVSPGLKLFLLSLMALVVAIVSPPSAYAMAFIPLVPKLNTDGLEGESKEFMEDLQKRFKEIKVDALTPNETNEAISKAINDAIAKFKDLDMAKIATLLDEKTGFVAMQAVIKKQGEMITELKETGGVKAHPSIRAEVAAWVAKHKEEISDIKTGKSRNLPPPMRFSESALTMAKVAAAMTNASSLGGSAYLPNAQVLPGVIDLVRVQPTFWSRLPKPSTTANPLVWVNKYNKQGNATFIGEGILKNLASFELQTESSNPKKVAERMKISREMLDDIDYIASMIQTELLFEVDSKCNTEVLTGVVSSTNPKGVTAYASAYTLLTITGIVDPNNSDAIRAAIAQLRSTNFNGQLTAFVNPIDAAMMDLQKTSQGAYVLPPFSTTDGRNIAATPVIEDNNIAVGYLLLGDMSKYHIQMYQDFFVEWGYENDDFTKNLITAIGERRFHQWVSGNETGAFIYDTFANIKTAIA